MDLHQDKKNLSLNWRLFFMILLFIIAGLYYFVLKKVNLNNSAALYIGLPIILALGLSLYPTKSHLGQTNKYITIALLLSSLFFGEGYICILFSAPIMYVVGGFIAVAADRKAHNKNKSNFHSIAIIGSLSLMSLEGTSPLMTVPRDTQIVVSEIVPASQQEILNQLSKPMQFVTPKPYFLRIFPCPVQNSGMGLNVGAIRKSHFVAYKKIWWDRISGELIMKITQSTPDHIQFSVIKDDSYLHHYLHWKDSDISLAAIDATHTRVTWKLSYTRLLDPAWYFGPLEHYAVSLSAHQLIENVATPRA